MCSDTTETHPSIEANAHHDAAPAYEEIIVTARTLTAQCEEAAALVKATRVQLEVYRTDAETLGRVKKELKAARKPVDDPAESVRVVCESEKELSVGGTIIRKMLSEWGYTDGSIPERLVAMHKSSKLTRPLEVPGYYDLDLAAGDEGCLSKDDSRINAWKRSMARACRVLDYYGIPASIIGADGNPRILFIDERVQLLAQKLNNQPVPGAEMKAAA